MLGAWVNFVAVILGALFGALLKKGMPERISNAMTTAVSMVVVYIGIDGMMSGTNTMVLVFAVIIGGLIGTLLDLDGKIHTLGNKVEEIFASGGSGKVSEGFVSATLLFCVGAMAIVGPLQSGLSGNHEMQFTKSVLDFISAIVFASALGGLGVGLSAFSVLLLQGGITLLAQLVSPYLTDYVIGEMTCAGSVLIFVLGLNLMGITKVKLMNYIPAILMPVVLCLFMK